MTPQDPLRMPVRDGLEMKYLPHYFQMHDRTNAERNMKSYKKIKFSHYSMQSKRNSQVLLIISAIDHQQVRPPL